MPIAARILIGTVGVAIAAAAVAHFVRVPQTVVDSNSARVIHVSVGSSAWIAGVRVGQPVTLVWADQDDGGAGFDIDTGGVIVGVSTSPPSPTGESLPLGGLLLLVAAAVRRAGIPGPALLVTLGAAVLVAPIQPAVGMPLALPFVALPSLVAIAATVHFSNIARFASRTAVVPVVLLVTFLLPLLSESPWPWDVMWLIPAIVAVAITLAGSFVGLRSIWAKTKGLAVGARLSRALHEIVPIAGISRINASNEERARLATELHNSVLPELGQAILEIDAGDPYGRKRLDEISHELRTFLQDRQLAVLQRAGLAPALRTYVMPFQAQIPLELKVNENAKRPPLAVEVAAYRIAQAAIANAVTHSGGDQITVSLWSTDRSVILDIADDGVGIDDGAEQMATARGHIGLADMRGQARAIGGELHISSAPDAGTTITFEWRA